MDKLTRRRALNRISSSGLAAALTVMPRYALAEDAGPPIPKRELFVLGPYPLGEWYRKSRHQIDDWFLRGAGITARELMKALNESRFYLIDQRVWKAPNRVRLADYKDGYPTVAVEGKLVHAWKDSKDPKLTIDVVEVKLCDLGTDDDASPPTRRIGSVNFGLRVQGSHGLISREAVYYFLSNQPILYDISGNKRGG